MPVAVDVAHRAPLAEESRRDAGALGDVLEGPIATIAVQNARVDLGAAVLGESMRVHEVEVGAAILVVIEDQDPVARGLEDVILGRAPAIGHDVEPGFGGPVGEPGPAEEDRECEHAQF